MRQKQQVLSEIEDLKKRLSAAHEEQQKWAITVKELKQGLHFLREEMRHITELEIPSDNS